MRNTRKLRLNCQRRVAGVKQKPDGCGEQVRVPGRGGEAAPHDAPTDALLRQLNDEQAGIDRVQLKAQAAGVALDWPAYMAPEPLEGRDTDARTDRWAPGGVLYEMVAGRRAFAGWPARG